MESRFHGSTGATLGDDSLSALLQNPWLRLFLFLGGPLPQTAKLCGLQGVPWAKALASMYLVPSLVFELLAFVDRRDQDQALPRHSPLAQQPVHHDALITVARISGCLAIAVQVSLWFIFAYMIVAAVDYQARAEGYVPSPERFGTCSASSSSPPSFK